jgi:anaerobic magnesium-protoporphyrin IX monomethyl ester cyclase
MASVLVGHSYFLAFDRKQFERAKPYPPLATLQAAALLRRAGHQVSLFDAMLMDGTQQFDVELHTKRPDVVVLYEDSFNYLSKMCLGNMRRAACDLIASARRAGARVIAGGSDVTDAPEVYLGAGADVVLIGEGLATLPELLLRLDASPGAPGADLIDELSNLAAIVDGRVLTARGAHLLPTPLLDETPAWDLVAVDRYRSMWLRAHGYFSLNMAASRGCSFRCAWCAKPIWGNRYLQRSAEAVAAEMAYLKRNFDPQHIWFADDIFGFRVDWVRRFSKAAQDEGAALPFTIQTRADLVTPAMAVALREAGCSEAWIGAESGSQRILDAMNKGTTVAEIVAARQRLGASGIRAGFFIQLGYLGEKLEDLIATCRLIEETRPDDIGVSVSYPLPGTRFYAAVEQQLQHKTRWAESDDLTMMFEGTYTSEFYRAVRDLLHEQVNVDNAQAGGANARSVVHRRWRALLDRHEDYLASRPTMASAGAQHPATAESAVPD